MRPVALGQSIGGDSTAKLNWIEQSLREIELASNEQYWPVRQRLIVSVSDFTASGADDSAQIQAAINACIARGGSIIYFPPKVGGYLVNTQLLADLSSYTTRYQNRLWFMGDGPGPCYIRSTTLGSAILKILGRASNVESYVRISGLRITGNAVAGSIGLQIDKAAFFSTDHFAIEGCDIGLDATDLEQSQFANSQFRFNARGVRLNGVGSVTDTNSIVFTDCSIGNNSTYGINVLHANAVTFVGGSIQYNGTIGGGTGQYGALFTEAGTGYGTVSFIGVAFEGNGGAGDLVLDQSTNGASIRLDGCAFLRTDFTTVGYGTNNINVKGTNLNTTLSFSCCRFLSAGYTPNAARPTIALTNTNCRILDDGTSYFQNTTETLVYPVAQTVLNGAPIAGDIYGLILSNSVGDPTNDIDISAGAAADSTNAIGIRLTSALTKRIDASWAVGTNQGGLDTGSVANNTGYFIWLIYRSDTRVVDALFSTSASAPTMPTGYTHKALIGWVRTQTTAIRPFKQVRSQFLYLDPYLDVAGVSSMGTSAVLRPLTVPVGVPVDAVMSLGTSSADAGSSYDCRGLMTCPDENDNTFAAGYFNYGQSNANSVQQWQQANCRTDTSAQIRTRNNASSATTQMWIATRGFVFPRGAQ